MALSYVGYPDLIGAVTDFAVPFGYLNEDHVTATVDGAPASFTWVNASLIRMDTAPVGDLVISRSTPSEDPEVTFVDGSTHSAGKHNRQNLQLLYVAQETQEAIGNVLVNDGVNFDAEGKKILNLGDPTLDTDAVNKQYADANIVEAAASAASAASSASSATTSKNAAAASASAAASSASAAAGYAASIDPDTLVEKAGDTMTGPLSVQGTISVVPTSGDAWLQLQRFSDGNHGMIRFLEADGDIRWSLQHNADGNFKLHRYSSAGVFASAPFIVQSDDIINLQGSGDIVLGDAKHIEWASGDFVQWVTGDGFRGYENDTFVWRLGSLSTTTRLPSVYSNTTASGSNVYVATDGALLRSTSTGEYKEERKQLTEALKTVRKLNPVSFKSTHELDGGRRFTGFIAEEVATEMPEASMDNGQNYDVRAIVSLQTKALQEAADLIDAQKVLIDDLIKRVEKLEGKA